MLPKQSLRARLLSPRMRAGLMPAAQRDAGARCPALEVFRPDAYWLRDPDRDAFGPVFVDVGGHVETPAINRCARWPHAQVAFTEAALGAFARFASNLGANTPAAGVQARDAAIAGQFGPSPQRLVERGIGRVQQYGELSFAPVAVCAPGPWPGMRAVCPAGVLADIGAQVPRLHSVGPGPKPCWEYDELPC